LARRGIHFRATSAEAVATAYRSMTAAEFNAVNGRQDWANWRTIPRALQGRVADAPLRVLDLGCGTGGSTQVLAGYVPAESHVTGYELAEPLLEFARRRAYANRAGQLSSVDFVCQGVTESLRQADGGMIADASVDVVNASGVVGHHLDAATVSPLIEELRRILRPDGIAMLDVGPSLRGRELRGLMEAAQFDFLAHCRSGWWDPTGQMVFGWNRGHSKPRT
jgi:SAM-dependent methyltransferase